MPGGDTWWTASAAADAARRGLLDHGSTWELRLARAIQRGHPGAPYLVERLDRPGRAYFLVPWIEVEGEGAVLLVEVDATSGAMLGVTALSAPDPSPLLTSEQALGCAERDLPGYTFTGCQLVWQPCRESTSPSRPFYRIRHEGGAIYVDMAGITYQNLTPLGHGG